MALGRFAGRTFKFMLRTFQVACITNCFFEYVAELVLCSGPSMEPTIRSNDVVVCDHIHKVEKGDIVVARSITNPNKNICKRVTGVAGDIVWNGSTYINIPRGYIWLTGDNAENSCDSRDYGAIPKALVRGRIVYRVWPFNEMCHFKKRVIEMD